MKYSDLTLAQLIELQEIISARIIGNTCKFTTSADIKYFETEEYLKAASNEK